MDLLCAGNAWYGFELRIPHPDAAEARLHMALVGIMSQQCLRAINAA